MPHIETVEQLEADFGLFPFQHRNPSDEVTVFTFELNDETGTVDLTDVPF